jgi:hypothetical protein
MLITREMVERNPRIIKIPCVTFFYLPMIGGPPPMMGRFFFTPKVRYSTSLYIKRFKKINYPEYPGHCTICFITKLRMSKTNSFPRLIILLRSNLVTLSLYRTGKRYAACGQRNGLPQEGAFQHAHSHTHTHNTDITNILAVSKTIT